MSAIYYVVVIDKKAKSERELLKSQDAIIKIEEEKRAQEAHERADMEEKALNRVKSVEVKEIVDIKSKEDAQEVLKEADEIVDKMDNISF